MTLKNKDNNFALIIIREGTGGLTNPFSIALAFVHELGAHVSGNIVGEGSGEEEHRLYGETSTSNGNFDVSSMNTKTPAYQLRIELYEMDNEYFDEWNARTKWSNGYSNGSSYTQADYLNDRKNGTLQTKTKDEEE